MITQAQPFSKYLADPRILEPVTEIFGGQHVRCRSNAGFFNPPVTDPDAVLIIYSFSTDLLPSKIPF